MARFQRNLLALAKRLLDRAAKNLHSVRASNMAPCIQDTETPWFYYPHSLEKLISSLFLFVTYHWCERLERGCPSKSKHWLLLGHIGVKGMWHFHTPVFSLLSFLNCRHHLYKANHWIVVGNQGSSFFLFIVLKAKTYQIKIFWKQMYCRLFGLKWMLLTSKCTHVCTEAYNHFPHDSLVHLTDMLCRADVG